MDIKLLVIILPLLIGFGMNLFVKNQRLENCGSQKDNKYTPPPYVFSIAWTTLYLIIGFVYYQYLKKYSIKSSFSIFMIIAFLALNLWNVIFRSYCLPRESLIYIIIITLVYFYIVYNLMKLNVKYWYLMIALLLWMSFASFLTYTNL